MREIEAKRAEWTQLQRKIEEEIQRSTGGISLADLVGGGNGWGTGAAGSGIDPSNGEIRGDKDRRGFLDGVIANRLNPTRKRLDRFCLCARWRTKATACSLPIGHHR